MQQYREHQQRERNRRDRLVWRAATRLFSERRMGIRSVIAETGFSFQTVYDSLRRLEALGYLRCGEKWAHGTWVVVVPFVEVAS